MAKSAKRIAAEKSLLEWIDMFIPGSDNKLYYEQQLFPSMNDAEFVQFMKDLLSGEKILAIITPNHADKKLDMDRNFEIAKKLGHDFFQRIYFGPTEGRPGYLSPIKYLVTKLPCRRQAQHLVEKISIPENNNSVDNFTGQPSGKSKASRISYPELQVLSALDLTSSISELIKFRGGDKGGFDAMNSSINKTGGVSLTAIQAATTGVESTKALRVFLTSMHYEVLGLQ